VYLNNEFDLSGLSDVIDYVTIWKYRGSSPTTVQA